MDDNENKRKMKKKLVIDDVERPKRKRGRPKKRAGGALLPAGYSQRDVGGALMPAGY